MGQILVKDFLLSVSPSTPGLLNVLDRHLARLLLLDGDLTRLLDWHLVLGRLTLTDLLRLTLLGRRHPLLKLTLLWRGHPLLELTLLGRWHPLLELTLLRGRHTLLLELTLLTLKLTRLGLALELPRVWLSLELLLLLVLLWVDTWGSFLLAGGHGHQGQQYPHSIPGLHRRPQKRSKS